MPSDVMPPPDQPARPSPCAVIVRGPLPRSAPGATAPGPQAASTPVAHPATQRVPLPCPVSASSTAYRSPCRHGSASQRRLSRTRLAETSLGGWLEGQTSPPTLPRLWLGVTLATITQPLVPWLTWMSPCVTGATDLVFLPRAWGPSHSLTPELGSVLTPSAPAVIDSLYQRSRRTCLLVARRSTTSNA